MSADWSTVTDDQLDLELAYSHQACFNDRCGDIFAPFMVCTRGSNHVAREQAAGFTVIHATGFTHNHSRVRWT